MADRAGASQPWYGVFLKSWQPNPSVNSTVVLFCIIGLAFVAFGGVLHAFNEGIIEVSKEYNDRDESVDVVVNEDMKGPVFVFYELDNFYQNHRRYIKSKSNKQLAGETISLDEAKSACEPVATNSQMGFTESWGGEGRKNAKPLDPNAVASPCGLIAKSFFNDTYQLLDKQNNNVAVEISEKGIAWPSDIRRKFKQGPDSETTQWVNPEDEHFIVWMRTAGLPNFRKLWGRIDNGLKKGTYLLKISNRYTVSGFGGTKKFVLSTSGPFGGKNRFLEIAYFVVGGICLLIAIIFIVKRKMTDNRFGEPIPDQRQN